MLTLILFLIDEEWLVLSLENKFITCFVYIVYIYDKLAILMLLRSP